MEATVVDLRYRMRDVLAALDRRESVTVLWRGKVKGVIHPVQTTPLTSMTEHPFFGMKKKGVSVEKEMETLRGGRYSDL